MKSSGEIVLFLVDSYAWVEYLTGSEKGKKVKELFEDKRNSFVTLECCLAELRGWSLKESQDFGKIYSVVVSNSEIVPIHTEEWIASAEEKFEKRKKIRDFGLIDSLLLVKQKRLNCRILTGDRHFKAIENAVYIGD